MAETLLSFGVEKLWDLLVRESDRLKGVDEQLDGLKSDLEFLRSFLKDADAKKHTSAMVRNSVTEIKEIVYDAEDIIETFLLNEELRKTSGIRNTVRRFTCGTLERRGLAFDMESLSKRISKVISKMKIHGVQEVNVNTQSLQDRQREMRQTFSSDTEEHLVGLEKNVEQLVGHLVEEDSSQVVSITGMGGLGKTTLAKQVFNHETVKSHFAGLAWVCVSQQCSRNHVWQTILRKLKPENKGSEMTEDELQENLVQVLKTQKALIVLDDIWKEDDWDTIKPMFPREKGWKVLLTSRNEGVGLRADPECFTFKPDCLTLEECWTIFQRKVFPRENSTEKEELGKKMIKHCGGLPLAIKVLGGLLDGLALSEWERICENIGSHIVGGTSFNDRSISSVYHILYLSFEELPIYLKHCFLYLAHFPEDYSIDVEKLSYYWVAEGIPRPRYYDGLTSREVADRYITELVKRNMVISERDAITSRFESCQLHDMMREVCLGKAKEENFVDIVDTANSQSPCKSRRITVYQDDVSYLPKGMMKNQKLRSLLFIQGASFMKLWDLLFTRLQSLRALDLSWAEFEGEKVPSSIGKLIHLRYLSLDCAEVTHLPSSMRNLKQLLYLNLCVLSSTSNVYMPNNVFNEMRELIYLSLPDEINDKVKIDLGNLVNLETLVNFSTKHSNVRDLQRMTRLETLKIKFNGGCTMENLSSSLSELSHLESLSIHDEDYKNDEEGFVLDCIHLKKVDLRIYMPRLPDEQHFPSNLTTISLECCCLEEDPMPILEKLLHLRNVNLQNRSFAGKKMVCSSGGFPQLQNLWLEGLEEWEEWIVEEGSMSLLHTLHIWDCKKLKKLRDGFPQLQKLWLRGLEEWEEWIVEEGSMPLLRTLTFGNCKKLKKLPDRFPQLQKLWLYGLEEWEEWIVEEGSMPLLHTLDIWECKKLKKLPDGFPQLQNLKLSELEEWEEWIVEEGSMPLLHTLTIWDCKKLKKLPYGFPQLQKLWLQGLEEWEEWIVEEGSMPLLHTLTICDCKKLKKLPDGLRFITSLKELKIYDAPLEFKEKLLRGGEDFYKVQHIPLVRVY